MTDENKPPAEPLLKKNIPDVLYPGVPIGEAAEEQKEIAAGAGSPPPSSEEQPGEEAVTYDEQPKTVKTKAKPSKEQDAYGTAAMLSFILLTVCFFFSSNFLEDIFLSRKGDYAYVPPKDLEFLGTAPPPILLTYSMLAVGLPVLVALFARFTCAKIPLDPILKVWGIYLGYFAVITLVSLEIQSIFLAFLCGIFFIVCFYILAYDKARKPRSLFEFIEYASELSARAAEKIE